LTTVAVKRGTGKFSARMIAPQRARQLIEEAATTALSNPQAVTPYALDSPCTIEVEFKVTDEVDKLRRRAGVEVVDDLRVRSTADRWWDAWQQFFF
jgi:D-amino peptidase